MVWVFLAKEILRLYHRIPSIGKPSVVYCIETLTRDARESLQTAASKTKRSDMSLFLENVSLPQIGLALFLAVLPVLMWLQLFFMNESGSHRPLIKAFLLGVFSVVPLMVIQYLWLLHPEWNVYEKAGAAFQNQTTLGFLSVFVAIGVFEEITKFNMLRYAHWFKLEVNSVSEAMRLIAAIALGFAFTENLFYFYSIATSGVFAELVAAFTFRSTFTTAGHMVFSAIVGYCYAIGKFGNPVLELDRWTGTPHPMIAWLQRRLHFHGETVFRFEKTIQGVFFAMLAHALFNLALQFHRVEYAAGIVAMGFIFILYLSRKRSTYLVFTEKEQRRPSTIGKTEENVVIELMGLWMKEKKYKEVIEICDRLSQRDPDNNVVKLFRATAIDRKKIDRVKKAIRLLFTDEDYDAEQEEISLFQRLKHVQTLKDQFKEGHYHDDLTPAEAKAVLVSQAIDHKIKTAREEDRALDQVPKEPWKFL